MVVIEGASVVDFNSLGLPGLEISRETDPKKIFDELPAGSEKISNLWAGQQKALADWHEKREKSDVVIELNTGAGKSLVGLLIAESSTREGRKVLYVCPTIDLVEQVAREAGEIGLKCSVRAMGEWSNDLYLTDRAFGITTYDAILTSRTHFRGDRAPDVIIFDDAHVAESKIRDQYTVHVDRQRDGQANDQFRRLAELIIDSAPDATWRSKFEGILNDRIPSDPRIAPFNFGKLKKAQLNEIFSAALHEGADPNFFTIEHIAGKWDRCICVFDADSIDVLAPIPPVLTHPVFASMQTRRVYLSATLTQESDFAKAFGRKVKQRIRPDIDAGDGERLIVMTRRFVASSGDEEAFVRGLVRDRKALFAVPSAAAARRWARIVSPVSRSAFTDELNLFRAKDAGAFILVGRFDGIDLPHNQCRLMVIDRIPAGSSLLERYLFDRLSLRAELAAKIATRLTQLFGRINRGRRDYGIYVITSPELKDWLTSHRNLALLPELLQKQILLGSFIQSSADASTTDKVRELVGQALQRDEGWTGYYGRFLKAQELNTQQAQFAIDREAALSELFVEQAKWFSRVWAGDASFNTTDLERAVAKMSTFDQKTAGVADLWLGMVKLVGDDDEGATQHFESAEGRLLAELPFIRVRPGSMTKDELGALDAFGRKQAKALYGGLNAVNERISKAAFSTLALQNWENYTYRQLEEAVRTLGEHIGFDASRPDIEDDTGPDVLWVDELVKSVLAFELKTEKDSDNDLTKDEIGQCHNHEEWVASKYSGYEYLGLLVVTDSPGVSGKASPSETMYQCSEERMRDFRAKFLDNVEAIKRQIMRGDLNSLKISSRDGTWSLSKIRDILNERPLVRRG